MDNQGPFAGENPYRSSGKGEGTGKAQYEDQEWLQRCVGSGVGSVGGGGWGSSTRGSEVEAVASASPRVGG